MTETEESSVCGSATLMYTVEKQQRDPVSNEVQGEAYRVSPLMNAHVGICAVSNIKSHREV